MQRPHKPADGAAWSATSRQRSAGSDQLRVLKGLVPYVWPSDRPDLQRTVVVSLLLMLAAKLVTVAMPFTYKWATDALVAAAGGSVPASETLPWLLGAPAAAIILYGLTRITM